MSSRRTAILIGAIAVGVIAVLLIVKYVQGVEDAANKEQELVPVFVATEEVKRGEDGGQAVDTKRIIQSEIPRKFWPSTAIQSTDAVTRKVALFNIAPGSVIVDGMFVDPKTNVISFRERLRNKNHVAVSIQVDQMRGVGGFLVPGDEVNMLIYQDNAKVKESIDSTGGNKPVYLPGLNPAPHPPENLINVGGPQWLVLNKTARYMFQKVHVLAVGTNQLLGPGEQATGTGTGAGGSGGSSAPPQQGANNSGMITFNVPPEAAQWIVTGQDAGFYLTLVGNDYAPRPLRPLPIIVDVLPGEDSAVLCPYKYDPDGNCEQTQ